MCGFFDFEHFVQCTMSGGALRARSLTRTRIPPVKLISKAKHEQTKNHKRNQQQQQWRWRWWWWWRRRRPYTNNNNKCQQPTALLNSALIHRNANRFSSILLLSRCGCWCFCWCYCCCLPNASLMTLWLIFHSAFLHYFFFLSLYLHLFLLAIRIVAFMVDRKIVFFLLRMFTHTLFSLSFDLLQCLLSLWVFLGSLFMFSHFFLFVTALFSSSEIVSCLQILTWTWKTNTSIHFCIW